MPLLLPEKRIRNGVLHVKEILSAGGTSGCVMRRTRIMLTDLSFANSHHNFLDRRDFKVIITTKTVGIVGMKRARTRKAPLTVGFRRGEVKEIW